MYAFTKSLFCGHIDLSLNKRFGIYILKKQKILYILLIFYTGIFLVSGVGAPIAAYFNNFQLAGEFYGLMSMSCHQNALRCFWLLGYPMALCARCFGIYVGTILMLLFLVFKKNIRQYSFVFVFILIFISVLEIVIEKTNIWGGNNFIRFIFGNIYGFIFVSIIDIVLLKYLKKEKNENI